MKNNWKKIDEQKPVKSGQYLVSSADGSAAVGYWVNGKGVFALSAYYWKESDIVAWCEFEPYEKLDDELVEKLMEGLL